MKTKKFIVKLNTILKVKDFVNTVSHFINDFDLCSDRYIVNAKSIMGIFSLDLTKELTLIVYSDSLEDLELIETHLKPFIVK